VAIVANGFKVFVNDPALLSQVLAQLVPAAAPPSEEIAVSLACQIQDLCAQKFQKPCRHLHDAIFLLRRRSSAASGLVKQVQIINAAASFHKHSTTVAVEAMLAGLRAVEVYVEHSAPHDEHIDAFATNDDPNDENTKPLLNIDAFATNDNLHDELSKPLEHFDAFATNDNLNDEITNPFEHIDAFAANDDLNDENTKPLEHIDASATNDDLNDEKSKPLEHIDAFTTNDGPNDEHAKPLEHIDAFAANDDLNDEAARAHRRLPDRRRAERRVHQAARAHRCQ